MSTPPPVSMADGGIFLGVQNMPILTFLYNKAADIMPSTFVFLFCDLAVTTFLQLAFGTTRGFFRYRYEGVNPDTGERKSIHQILKEGGA